MVPFGNLTSIRPDLQWRAGWNLLGTLHWLDSIHRQGLVPLHWLDPIHRQGLVPLHWLDPIHRQGLVPFHWLDPIHRQGLVPLHWLDPIHRQGLVPFGNITLIKFDSPSRTGTFWELDINKIQSNVKDWCLFGTLYWLDSIHRQGLVPFGNLTSIRSDPPSRTGTFLELYID